MMFLWAFPVIGFLALANLVRLAIVPQHRVKDSCLRLTNHR